MFSCVFVTFPNGVPGQMWYLIELIPDLCLLFYFYIEYVPSHSLTLYILMDFPIHMDTISMGLPIVYFKGSQVEFSEICISVPVGCFQLSKQCRP